MGYFSMKHYVTLASAICLSFASFAAVGQTAQSDFPSKTVRIVVGTPPGAGVDAITRYVAEAYRKKLDAVVVVENKPGAGGLTAAEMVSRAESDGYTLFATHAGPLAATALHKKLSYDPNSLTTIAVLGVSPMVLAAKQDLPFNTLSEILAEAKREPGKLMIASSGYGSMSHLTSELLMERTGSKFGHVPYRGAAAAINDLAGGQVDLMSVDLGSLLPILSSKRVKVIAVAAKERLPELPDVPTFAEAGLPDFTSSAWWALAAPSATPEDRLKLLNQAAVSALQSKDAEPFLRALSARPMTGDLDAVSKFINSERTLWTDLIKRANISVE
jgi:tripartite-type tricarboxylate transporter receptor subunit TctC